MLDLPIIFTLKDLFYLIFYFLIAGVLYYLIRIFREIYLSIKKINTFCDENNEDISKIIKESSDILEKTNIIVTSVDEKTKDVKEKISNMHNLTTIFQIISDLLFKKNK